MDIMTIIITFLLILFNAGLIAFMGILISIHLEKVQDEKYNKKN